MNYEPRLISPFDNGGLITYYKPFLIGDQAFPVLEDAYAWRGTLRKREGYSLLATIPTVPVQGLKTYYLNTGSSQQEQTLGFSTTKSYLLISSPSIQFSNISFFQTTGAAISWSGTSSDFFWSCNFAGSLWATNNVDPLRFWNGTPGSLGVTGGWNNQRPTLDGSANVLQKCALVLPYKGRLVVLNTQEGTIDGSGNPLTSTNYFQRARWCQLGTTYVPATGGDPAVVTPSGFTTDTNAWRQDIPGRGGYIDADTNERIVSAAIIKDILIVFFQRSTWRLRYTGNEVLPFIWERINTQYGSESALSTISFDEGALSFSRFGFVESDTNQVVRIDQKIPDQTFFEMKYGTSAASLQVVQGIRDYYRQTAYWCYQDTNQTATFNNQVLAYNYLDKTWAIFNQHFRTFGYYKQFFDLQWQNATFTWSSSNSPWQGPEQAQFPQVLAAEADPTSGNVYVVYETTNDAQDVNSDGSLSNFNFDIITKKFNPYLDQGHRCRLQYVDVYCSANDGGVFTLNAYLDDEEDTPQITKIVQISETQRSAKYVRVFLGAIGRLIQLELTLSPSQLADPDSGQVQLEIQGLVIWTRKEGRIKQ